MTPRVLGAAAVVLGVASVVTPAQAQMAVAVGGNLPLPVDPLQYGVVGRFGYRTGLGHGALIHTLIFQPEVVAGFVHLPSLADSVHHPDELRAGGGLRLGCLCGLDSWVPSHAFAVEPFAFGHIYGAWAADGLDIAPGGLLYDVGGALEVRVADWSVGFRASYDHLTKEGPHAWAELGVDVEYRWFAW